MCCNVIGLTLGERKHESMSCDGKASVIRISVNGNLSLVPHRSDEKYLGKRQPASKHLILYVVD